MNVREVSIIGVISMQICPFLRFGRLSFATFTEFRKGAKVLSD